jgi:GrpB-like predicted nucleotidyltransferase (UPF0157 family)
MTSLFLDEPIRFALKQRGKWRLTPSQTASVAPTANVIRALQIEHTRSISVLGLAAKPSIDTHLVVADLSDQPAYVPILEPAR